MVRDVVPFGASAANPRDRPATLGDMTEPDAASRLGMDPDTAELAVAVPCTTEDEVVGWFRAVEEAHEANPEDPDAFAEQVRAQAGAFDQQAVEAFLERAAASGLPAVARLLEYLPARTEVYWELVAPPTAEDTEPDGWVSDTHAGQLAATWGDQWRTHLGEQLDHRWGTNWQDNPTEHKQAWLTDLLPELLTPPADGAEAEVDLDRLAQELVRETVTEVAGAESLSEEELAAAIAAVRRNLEESNV
jgi:hypothetical protein